MASKHELEADVVIQSRIARLRTLTFAEAAALPEADGEETIIGDQACALTVFMQNGPHALPNQILVTVQVARRGLFGMWSSHIERGLVFSADGRIREATDKELQNSGG